MLELAGTTPINLSKPGTPTPSSNLLASTLPAHTHRPPPGHELVVHCQKHASGSAMASGRVTANFAYQKPGTQPPVYVAGTFSDPPWQPHEMTADQRDDGEYVFTKSWPVDEGVDVQYKYRIGEGDWWVLDEGEQIIDDGHGNLNNKLSTAHLARDNQRSDTDIPLPSRLGALRGSGTPSRSETPDFVRTTIEVSDSAALLHDEVPRREVPRHVPPAIVDLHPQIHTPIEEVARTASEVADTAATLDREDSSDGGNDDNYDTQRDDPPMLAHECMNTKSNDHERSSRSAEISSSPQKRQFSPWKEDSSIGPAVDLDDPRLERFPSERSAIYAAVRRLSTSVEHDDVAENLAIPRSPGFRPDERTLEGGFAAFPIDIEEPADGRGFLRASDPSHSPDKDVGLKSVSSLQSIPEGDDDEAPKDTTRKSKSEKQALSLSKTQTSGSGGHADDEGIAMSFRSRERTPGYTWEQKPRGRSGSVTDQDILSATDDAGPSKVAINHTQIDTPHVLVHGPEIVNDGEDSGANGEDVLAVKPSPRAKSHEPNSPVADPRPGTRSSVRSAQTVASLQKTESSVTWLQSWFRVLFVDFFGGIFKRLFRR